MNHPAQPAPEGALPSHCFWPSGCSDKTRCLAFNGCVADAQNKAARLAREKPNDAASVAAQLANDPQAEIGVLRLIKADLEADNAALRARCERLEGALKPFAALAGLSSVKACDDAAEPFMTGADILGNRKTIITVGDIRKAVAVYNDALAQPEDGK